MSEEKQATNGRGMKIVAADYIDTTRTPPHRDSVVIEVPNETQVGDKVEHKGRTYIVQPEHQRKRKQ